MAPTVASAVAVRNLNRALHIDAPWVATRSLERAVSLAPRCHSVRRMALRLQRKLQYPPFFVQTLLTDAEYATRAAPWRRGRATMRDAPPLLQPLLRRGTRFDAIPFDVVVVIAELLELASARSLGCSCRTARDAVRAITSTNLPTSMQWNDAFALATHFASITKVYLLPFADEAPVYLNLASHRLAARLGLSLHERDLQGDMRAALVLGALYAASNSRLVSDGADAGDGDGDAYSFAAMRASGTYDMLPTHSPLLIAACVGALARNAHQHSLHRVRFVLDVYGVRPSFTQLRRAIEAAMTQRLLPS
jgi:hypothetical protein